MPGRDSELIARASNQKREKKRRGEGVKSDITHAKGQKVQSMDTQNLKTDGTQAWSV